MPPTHFKRRRQIYPSRFIVDPLSLLPSGNTTTIVRRHADGSLPAGLSFGYTQLADGSVAMLIYGTPSGVGTSNFTVQASSIFTSPVQTATANLSITVDKPVTPVIITTVSVPKGKVGIPYHTQLMATGGKRPYTWGTLNFGLPPGLSLSTSGLISGTPTPTTAGFYYSPHVIVDDSGNPLQYDSKFLFMFISP
jgi:large repetitive protein